MNRMKRVILPLFLFLLFSMAGEAGASIIPVTKFRSPNLTGGAPAGWALERKSGSPSLKMEKEGEYYYLRLQSDGRSSFGIRAAARVNVKDYQIISWRWKAYKLPVGADVRKKETDDQALQVYVAFKETGFPASLNTPVIGYIWDTEAPKGWSGRSRQIGGDKLRYIVLRNKTDKTGTWYTERRNIYEDYKRLFSEINGGEPLGVTTGLQLYINTQRTKTPADGLIGDIFFSSDLPKVAQTTAAGEPAVATATVISAPKPSISAPRRKSIPQAPDDAPMVDNFNSSECFSIAVVFETNSIDIDENGTEKLKPLQEYLLKHPRAGLLITGHTDNVGSITYNRILSRLRAESVKNYLVEKFSVDAKRIWVKGAGPDLPVADNSTPEGQAQNRRVLIQTCPE